jgi:hypothetical protein
MVSPLRARFKTEFTRTVSYGYNDRRSEKDVERMQRFDLAARGPRPFADVLKSNSIEATFNHMKPGEVLTLLDWLIRDNVANNNLNRNVEIEKILQAGGSKWKVGVRGNHPGLEQRVPQGVEDAAEAAMARPGDAGRLLSEAWHATYGMNHQPDLGYRKAIEAVEAVVLPIVAKNDSSATLGKAIGQMRAQGDWKLPFIKEHAQNPSQDVVLGMMQALWSGHSDRHPGTQNYIQSTQPAAEAAVSLAVSLVNLFSNGGIARRP